MEKRQREFPDLSAFFVFAFAYANFAPFETFFSRFEF